MKSQTTLERLKPIQQVSPGLVKTTAHSIYQNLIDDGYAMRDIIALSTQLLGFASQELIAVEKKEHPVGKT